MKIVGVAWAMIVIFIILVLLVFIACAIKINSMYDDENIKK